MRIKENLHRTRQLEGSTPYMSEGKSVKTNLEWVRSYINLKEGKGWCKTVKKRDAAEKKHVKNLAQLTTDYIDLDEYLGDYKSHPATFYWYAQKISKAKRFNKDIHIQSWF